MKPLHRISTTVFAAFLGLAVLVSLINVGQAQDASLAPEITASISGAVYDSAGQPLANIEVTALSREQYGYWSTVRSTKTDASGAYTLGYLNTAIYRLKFRDEREQFLTIYHPNAMEVEGALDIPVAGVDVTGIQTYLRSGLRIVGVVTDASGQPLPDITVAIYRQSSYGSWPFERSARTDASGVYTLSRLYPTTYRLGFQDPQEQFIPRYYPDAQTLESAQDIVVSDADVTGLQIYLRPTLRIEGTVTDASGQPLPDIDVSIYRQSGYGSWPFVRSARTDASGVYTLSRLYPATYRLGFRAPQEQFIPLYYPDAQNLESAQDIVVSDADVTGLRTSLQRSAQITGVVSMWDGSWPDSGVATVYAEEDGKWKNVKGYYLSWSNAAMRYAIIGLLPGRYRIGVRGDDYNGSITNYYDEFYNDAATVQAADDIVLEMGDVVTDVNFVLGDNPYLSDVSGIVTTPEGAGLPGIAVTAYISKTRDWEAIRSTHTITDGAYTLRALPAGNYTVRFHDPLRNFVAEYYDDAARVDAATILSITGGSDLTGINAGLTPTGRIVAEITMYDGRPPRDAEVSVYSAADGYDKLVDRGSVSNSSGQPVTITLPGLVPGVYRLYIVANDGNNTYSEYYNDALLIENAADVTVLSAETSEIHAVLGENPGYGRILGTVRASGSAPLANIKVTALYQNPRDSSYWWRPRQSTFTDHSGSYSLWALTPNTYTVKFEDPEGAYLTQYYIGAADEQSATRIRVESGQTSTGVDAVLAQTGMLTGTVTLYDGRPPVWGSVTLYRWTTEYGWSSYRSSIDLGYSKPTSSYRFIQLPTGTYRVGVSASFGDGETFERFYPNATTVDEAQDIAVTDGATTPNINFVFGQDKRDARIEGQVYADGIALPGMQVDLYTNKGYGDWQRLVYVTTDALGAFRIDGLPAGEYRICIVDPAQVRATLCYPGVEDVAGASTFILTDGQVISDLRIEMVRLDHWAYLPVIGR